MAINQEVWGATHPQTALSLQNLGGLFDFQGDRAAARPYYEQALAITQESLGPAHPDTTLLLDLLVSTRAAVGDWAPAAALADQSRRAARQHVARVLPSLSAREQAMFLSQNDLRSFHKALTLGWLRRDDAELAALACSWLLNGKAVAQEALAQTTLLARESRDPAISATVKQLLELRLQMSSVALAHPKPGEEASRREQIVQLERQEETLARQITEAHGERWQADAWVDVAAVRQAIPAGAMLIDIARFHVFNFAAKGRSDKWLPERYVAWLIPPAGEGKIRIVDLGEAQLIDSAAQTRRQSTHGGHGRQRDDRRSRRAGRGGAAKEAAGRSGPASARTAASGDGRGQRVVSPDAALWLVPWSALPLADGRYAML